MRSDALMALETDPGGSPASRPSTWRDEIIEDARRRELERALRLLQAGRDAAEVMEALSHRLTNKLLHAPTRALHERVTTCTSKS